MQYPGLFEMPPLLPVLLSAVQTFLLFIFILVALRFIGRRVFGEQNPQDLITLILLADACGAGLSDARAGFWGSAASVSTILLLGWMMDRIPFVRKLIESGPVILYKNGRLYRKHLERSMIDVPELDTVARRYGLASYQEFSQIVLEGDGEITATIRKRRALPDGPDTRNRHERPKN